MARAWGRAPSDVALTREVAALAATTARAVRSGSGLEQALAEAAGVASGGRRSAEEGPATVALAEVVASLRRGERLDDALDAWGRRADHASVSMFVAACRFGHAHGGDLPAALDGASVTLLDHVDAAEEARAMASQARTSAAALGALPVLGLAGFSVLDPRVPATLLGTPAGWVCLVLGAGFEVAGVLVLRRMVRGALR